MVVGIIGMSQPILETDRLLLRPFTLDDVAEVTRLVGERQVAETTLNIPHPYSNRDAVTWIGTLGPGFEAGTKATYASMSKDGQLLGAAGLEISVKDRRAELGYWTGLPWWNNGYATEASRALVAYAFGELGLHRVHACHLAGNPASGRVMEKLGMRREGVLREHTCRRGRPEDIVQWGILRGEYGYRGSDPQ